MRSAILYPGWENARESRLGIRYTWCSASRPKSYSAPSSGLCLLQRRKSRDLFDLYHGLGQLSLDAERLIACFEHYLALEGTVVSRAMAEQRMLQKLTRSLTEVIGPLLPAGIEFTDTHAIAAFNRVWTLLIARIKGEAWKSGAEAITELRNKKHPLLLP